jgi:hypothetical protein
MGLKDCLREISEKKGVSIENIFNRVLKMSKEEQVLERLNGFEYSDNEYKDIVAEMKNLIDTCYSELLVYYFEKCGKNYGGVADNGLEEETIECVKYQLGLENNFILS